MFALPDATFSSDVQFANDVLPGTEPLVADVPPREVAVPADTNGSQDVTAPGDAGLDGQIPIPLRWTLRQTLSLTVCRKPW